MRTLEKKRVSIELGDGVVIDVDIWPVLSGSVVPKPPPKLIARLAVGIDDCSGKSEPMQLEIEVAVNHRSPE